MPQAAATTLERVMYFRSADIPRHSVKVIPAYAGIQAVPWIWIPAYAEMTFKLCIQAHRKAFNIHNTL